MTMETPEKEDIGQELRENNEKIVECILLLRDQRDELGFIIERQYEERKKLETEMERITYKLCLINKSLAQRIKAKQDYDNTLNEIESNYAKLVKDSGDLLLMIKKEFEKLDSMINKRTSTDDAPKYENYEAGKANGSGEQIQEIDQFGSDINRGTSRGTSQGTNQHCRCKPKPVQENTNESSELEIPTKEEPEPEDPSKSTSIIDKQRKRSTLSDDRRPRIMDRIPSSHNEI